MPGAVCPSRRATAAVGRVLRGLQSARSGRHSFPYPLYFGRDEQESNFESRCCSPRPLGSVRREAPAGRLPSTRPIAPHSLTRWQAARQRPLAVVTRLAPTPWKPTNKEAGVSVSSFSPVGRPADLWRTKRPRQAKNACHGLCTRARPFSLSFRFDRFFPCGTQRVIEGRKGKTSGRNWMTPGRGDDCPRRCFSSPSSRLAGFCRVHDGLTKRVLSYQPPPVTASERKTIFARKIGRAG